MESMLNVLYNPALLLPLQQQAALTQADLTKTPNSLTDPYKLRSVPSIKNEKKETITMFGEFKKDVNHFIVENKSLIYGIIVFYLLDHFIFEGKFKAKLLELANRMISSLEKKVDKI